MLYGQEGILDMEGRWLVGPLRARLQLLNPLSFVQNSTEGGFWKDMDGRVLAQAEKSLRPHELGFLETREDGRFRLRNGRGNLLCAAWLDSISPLLGGEVYILQLVVRMPY